MSDIAIKVEGLSKLYRIGQREPYRTLRDTITNAFTSPFRGLRNLRSSISHPPSVDNPPSSNLHPSSDTIWALKDLSFEVKQGEVMGIIGPNGAGKSTLLKILSEITEPTEGWAEIHGRLGALLEVGTGFHTELTGRENIYLNGAILGMRRAEISKNFDEMVAFAEVEKFIDTPVKHYSTGMAVRLGFAVAAHLEPEILLVDEVLAVGDVAFRKKCMGKMDDVAKGGRTVLFVSHNMGAIRQLCNRAIWLDQGKIAGNGEAEKVVGDYLASSSRGFIFSNLESDFLRIEKVVLRNQEGRITSSFLPGDDLVVEIHFFAKKYIRKPFFWVGVVGEYGTIFGASMLVDGYQPDSIEGSGILTCTLRKIPLLPQTYTIRMGVRAENGVAFLVRTAEVAFFAVDGTAEGLGWKEDRADTLMGSRTPVFVPYEWKLPDGRIFSVEFKWHRTHEKMFLNSKN